MNKAQKDRNIVAKIVSPFDIMMSKEEVYDFIQSNWVAEQREHLLSPGWHNYEWSQDELYDASAYIAMLLISKTAKWQKVIANLQWQHVTRAKESDEFEGIWTIVVEDQRTRFKTKKAVVLGVLREDLLMMD